jgi:glycosyltransferase involved in cell wall biosynthesis
MLIGLQYAGGLELSELHCQLLSSYKMRPIPNVFRAVLRHFNLPPPGVRRYLQSLQPNVAHVHFGTDLVALWPMLNHLQVPIMTTLHGYDINIHPEFWRRSWRASRKYPERLQEISRDPRVHFIAVSEAIKERAIELGLPAQRVMVRYIGVDTEQFVPGDTPLVARPRRILFVGRAGDESDPGLLSAEHHSREWRCRRIGHRDRGSASRRRSGRDIRSWRRRRSHQTRRHRLCLPRSGQRRVVGGADSLVTKR